MINKKLLNNNRFLFIIKAAINIPKVKINRNEFLRKELSPHFSKNTVELAVVKNPAYAGITIEELDYISECCIKSETNKVSLISAASSIPGGLSLFGTISADIIQYFAYVIRIIQKLMYLYGWPELFSSDDETDDEILSKITLFIGVMSRVTIADKAILNLSKKTTLELEKKIVNVALTKEIIFPVAKKCSNILGMKLSKEVFAKSVSKLIPIIGGITAGGLTYLTFKTSAEDLKKQLEKLPTADVAFHRELEYDKDIMNVDFVEI